MNVFRKFYLSLRLFEATRRACMAHKLTGERYYVIPIRWSNKLVVMNRYEFRKFKRKRMVNRNAYVADLERECFYHTPYRSGDGALSEADAEKKRKEYYIFCENTRRKQKK